MMKDDYYRAVEAQAKSIAAGMVQEYDHIKEVLDTEGEGACYELDQEWEQSATNTEPVITRCLCGKLEYEVGLAGPHHGSTNIWLEGEIEHRDSGEGWPKTVALCFWASYEKGTVELEKEGPFQDFVYHAIGGACLDDTLQWLRVPTTDCLHGRHDWMGDSKRWHGYVSSCRHCDVEWWIA